MPDRGIEGGSNPTGPRSPPDLMVHTGTPTRNPLIETCFPHPVVAFDVGYTQDDPVPPLASELVPFVARAVASRRSEFAFGRECAQRAVAELGAGNGVVGRGPDRAPTWPDGISGSISHVDGYAVAVAAPTSGADTVGIDVVGPGSVTDDIVPVAFTGDERTRLTARHPLDLPHARAVAFGAKEALFKAQHQLTRRWVDFHEVEVTHLGATSRHGPGHVELSARPGSALARDIDWPVHARWVAIERRVVVGVTTSGTPASRPLVGDDPGPTSSAQ